MTALFYLSIILFAGVFLAKLVSYVKLPDVTGYLIAGLLIGPSLFHFIPREAAAGLSVVSETALAFIAFSIGSQFDFEQLKKVGSGIWLITVCEALGAVVAVDLAMIFLFKQSVSFSLVLGAIAAATAPAATLMVVKQYKAKGPLVDTLLPVVAADDAVGIMAFGISVAVAKSMTGASHGITMTEVLLKPIGEILGALVVGVIIGLLFTYIGSRSKGQGAMLTITAATVLLGQGIASALGLSSLLLCMSIGMVMANLSRHKSRILSNVEAFTPPIFVAFFTLAGVNMDLGMLKNVGLIGVGYILIRVFGKVLGAAVGSRAANSPKAVQKYLGLTLMPQAGVAIGLAMLTETAVPEYAPVIQTIVLGATVIYELFGPLVTKICLIRAGEAGKAVETASASAA